MTQPLTRRAHLIAGGYPPGSHAGHDHDFVRRRLLDLLAEQDIPASVGNDFDDVTKWLPVSRLLVTYVAGPYPDATQCGAMADWLRAGGHWLALHGTSGGRAARVEGLRQRRTVKAEHHALLGSFFLTHPPICKFRVEIEDPGHPLTRGIKAFDVEDEPYFIELQDAATTHVLLTAKYGAAGDWPVTTQLYGADTSLLADGSTRVIGYTRPIGRGAVTYFALGHCHNPAIHAGRSADGSPPAFHGAFSNDTFNRLLRNAIGWSTGENL